MDRILSRILAACRSFRRAMCAAIAGSHRLPPQSDDNDVLPHSVRGIFSNYSDNGRPYLFARPRGTGPEVDGTFSSIPGAPDGWDTILDHCNGLILYDNDGVIPSKLYVCNPATWRWALLPPPHDGTRYAGSYLVFDPTVSLEYKIFMIPEVPENEKGQTADMDLMEWPPLHQKLLVFSSTTQRWVETAFLRESHPCGTVAEARLDPVEPMFWGPERRYAEYWRGALYVHCRGAYVMRLSLSEDKFQAIKTPTNIEENKYIQPFFGRSEKGVYYATVKDHELRIWILDERGEQTEWVLKHHANLGKLCGLMKTLRHEEILGPWSIVDYSSVSDEKYEVVSEWESDEDYFYDMQADIDSKWYGGMKFNFIGFHPYKEIVYLSQGFRIVAYHLSSSRAQYLGSAWPPGYGGHCASFGESFVYTSCLIDSLPNKSKV
ncbi:unnamed protein product [Urochloa decumbens]|uniref:Uncharacterized protein n=1 Tax=Urochloa decumbens TaxID=240449 RepID=A0ABC9D8J4_9POAL